MMRRCAVVLGAVLASMIVLLLYETADSDAMTRILSSMRSGHSTEEYQQTAVAATATTRTLVMAQLQKEDTSWVLTEFDAEIAAGELIPNVYVVDNSTAPNVTPANKGHEAMAYLTYVIDHYDGLQDITIFMHSHRKALHNVELLDYDAVHMLRALSDDRVERLGYMNLRCIWHDECPGYIQPFEPFPEQDPSWILRHFNASFAQIFPEEELPSVVAQACCGQFALSKKQIRAMPRERYIAVRQWLLDTDLNDYTSGRVLEFLWQFIFTKRAVYCPSHHACLCDGYGICFDSPAQLTRYQQLQRTQAMWEKELVQLRELKKHDKVRIHAIIEKQKDLAANMTSMLEHAIKEGGDAAKRAQAAHNDHL